MAEIVGVALVNLMQVLYELVEVEREQTRISTVAINNGRIKIVTTEWAQIAQVASVT